MNKTNLDLLYKMLGEINKPQYYIFLANLNDIAVYWNHLSKVENYGHTLIWNEDVKEGQLIKMNESFSTPLEEFSITNLDFKLTGLNFQQNNNSILWNVKL